MSERFCLVRHYDHLWQTALAAFAQGQVELDPFLDRKHEDRRRGLTLLIRPSPAVAQRISGFLAGLIELEPEQYAYPPGDYHLTLLSLYSAGEQHGFYLAHLPAYLTAVETVLRDTAGFKLHFRGITASPGAVMIQGFPEDGTLDEVRERLRQELRQAGLAEGLDRRYRIRTAHLTVFRFRQPLRNLPRLCAQLAAFREHDFGRMRVQAVELVENDWYMSADRVQVIKRYLLAWA